VTVILLSCSYNDQEFVRIGYYVNTEFEEGTLKQEWDNAQLDPTLARPEPSSNLDKLVRNVLANKPRVTKFNIKW
jgi:histone chaperone ASF1